jgi:hypothetical protein
MKPKVIYAILGASATGFFIGWLIFGLLLDSYYKSETIVYEGLMKTPPEIWAIVLMNMSWATLLVYIFHIWADIRSFAKGFTVGLIVMFLCVFGFDISTYGFMNLMTFQGIVVDIIANTVLGGLVGGVAGLILGTGEKKS